MVMQIMIEIPDDLAGKLSAPGQDPVRAALEAIAYRQQRHPVQGNSALLALKA
jgi:hypothetical protein